MKANWQITLVRVGDGINWRWTISQINYGNKSISGTTTSQLDALMAAERAIDREVSKED